MKNKKMKNLILIIIYILIVLGVSYLVTYYVDEQNKSGYKANLFVTFDDNEYYDIPNSKELTMEEALLEWPYIFTIKNNGNKGSVYQILINDDEKNDIKRDNLAYLLYLNDNLIIKGNLKDIVGNVLYTGDIKANKEQKYKLYIYKNNQSEGEIYRYSLKLNAILEGGPGF